MTSELLDFKQWRLNEKKTKKESCLVQYKNKDGLTEEMEISYNDSGVNIKCKSDIKKMFENDDSYNTFKAMADGGSTQAELLKYLKANTIPAYSGWGYGVGTDNDSGDSGD